MKAFERLRGIFDKDTLSVHEQEVATNKSAGPSCVRVNTQFSRHRTGFVDDFGGGDYVFTGGGLGFIAERNIIMTALHVVRPRNSKIEVAFANGSADDSNSWITRPAKVIWGDSNSDVVTLWVDGEIPGAALTFGDSDPVRSGEPIFNLKSNPTGNPTFSKCKTKKRRLELVEGGVVIPNALRFKNSVTKGDSGGPILDSQRTVVGLLVAGDETGGGIAVPAQNLKSVLEEAKSMVRQRRGRWY